MYKHNEIPADAGLPKMSAALNISIMKDVFEHRFFEQHYIFTNKNSVLPRFTIRDCQIARVKYKPGKNCRICYRLEIFDAKNMISAVEMISAIVYPRGGSHSRFRKARQQPLKKTPFGKGVLHIPELDMVLWIFPNDRKLTFLPKIQQREWIQRNILPVIVAKMAGKDWKVRDFSSHVVHYVPEHASTQRLDIIVENRETAVQGAFSVFGKTYYDAEGERTFENMQRLWQTPARLTGNLNIAQPLAYFPESRSLWQAGLTGKTLFELGIGTKKFFAGLRNAAKTLAVLHDTRISIATDSENDDIFEKLTTAADLVGKIQHSNLPQLNATVEKLQKTAAHISDSPRVILHGDLHLKNFIIHRDQAALIDLDNLLAGPPARDLGSFVAGIFYTGLIKKISGDILRQTVDIFLQSYRENASAKIAEADLRWHIAAALIYERAFRAISRLKSPKLDLLGHLSQLAAQIFEEPQHSQDPYHLSSLTPTSLSFPEEGDDNFGLKLSQNTNAALLTKRAGNSEKETNFS